MIHTARGTHSDDVRWLVDAVVPRLRQLASLSLSLNFITRVAPHCVNTLMILHAAHTLMTSAG